MGPKNGMLTTNAFWSLRSKYFPREYAGKMINAWALNREEGFYGKFFPLAMARKSMKDFASPVDLVFGYTPDTAYFTSDGMFRQVFPRLPPSSPSITLRTTTTMKTGAYTRGPGSLPQRRLTLFGDNTLISTQAKSSFT